MENPERIAFRWWEKKRPYFNLAVGIAGGIGLSFAWLPPMSFVLVGSLMWALFVNACFCLGFFAEMLTSYYFKMNFYSDSTRMILFIFGTVAAVLVSLIFPSLLFSPVSEF